MMWADMLVAFVDLTGPLFWIVRGVVALVAGIAGWFLAGPVAMLLSRVAFHRPAPGWGVLLSRFGGAALLGFIAFYYLPLGGGGGLGWGPGQGGGPGAGPGKGDGGQDKSSPKTDGKTPANAKLPPGTLEIELLGGERYKNDECYYLIARKPPAKTINEVEEHLKEAKDVSLLYIILLPEGSVGKKHPAVGRLTSLADERKIKHSVWVEESVP